MAKLLSRPCPPHCQKHYLNRLSFPSHPVHQVKEDSYTAFEDVWKTRESHLKEMPGFIRFAMLKCK